MRNFILTTCLLFIFLSLKSQRDIGTILSSGNNFEKMCQEADFYFSQKHPDFAPKDLAIGEHRDGEYVKYMRWRNFWESSLNPDGTLGDLSAYHQNQLKAPPTDHLYEDIEWTNISNTEFIRLQISMGRTTCIAFHPTDSDIFYVGAAIGGIWKTEDGGKSYLPLGDELPFLAVSSIVVDQQNPNIIYLSVGDHLWNGLPSIGVYKSMDGGVTWNPTSLVFSTAQNRRIYWITAHPEESASLLVATTAGLYKTTDGFATYTQLTSSTCTQVHYKYGDSDIVYLGTDDGEFLKSIDGGDNFSLIEDFGNRTVRIALTKQDPEKVVVAHATSLMVSTDSGTSFPDTYPLPEDNNAQQVCINPKNAEDYVIGYFELFRTTDGGSNFTQIFHWLGNNDLPLVHVDMRNAYVNPLQDDRLYFCHDGGVDVYNIDTGEFTNLSDGLIITQFYDIAVSQTETEVISGGSQDNGSMYRDENGNWDDLAGTGDGMITEIDPTNEDIIFWEYQFGGMRRFSGANNTNISPTGEDGNGAWITPFCLDPSNSERLIAGYQNIYESLNQGDTWTRISDELAGGSKLNHIAIAESDGERIYVTQARNLYVKATDSDIWTNKSLPFNGVTDIEVDPNDMNKIVVTFGGYTNGSKVYISDDAGDTWINISDNLPNVRIGAVEYYKDIDNSMFVGSEAGVYYRDDNSSEWIPYGKLPNTRITDIEIQYSDQKIRVGTYGRGVFEADIDIEVCDENSPDQDDDGICDTYDTCPNLDDALIGTACDDGDPLSSNEMYSTDCICEGGESNLIYCNGAGSAGTGSDYIELVQLEGIFNNSAKTEYSDFRNISTELYEDGTYLVLIQLAFSFDPDTAYAWIDYDRSGAFDETELIVMSKFDDNHTSTGTFTVPKLNEYGATTMRVRNIYSNDPSADPCDSYFGEVEDYTIQLREFMPGIVDLDQDGYATDEDCDDDNPDINPGQNEEPYNGIDDDCDETTLDDDLDQDGFALAEDCDDTNQDINPDAVEIPNNGIDEDCDGMDLVSSTFDLGNSTINIFPNPASEIINIVVAGQLEYQLNLYDLNGLRILSVTNVKRLSVDELPSGLYLLELKDLKTEFSVVDRVFIR